MKIVNWQKIWVFILAIGYITHSNASLIGTPVNCLVFGADAFLYSCQDNSGGNSTTVQSPDIEFELLFLDSPRWNVNIEQNTVRLDLLTNGFNFAFDSELFITLGFAGNPLDVVNANVTFSNITNFDISSVLVSDNAIIFEMSGGLPPANGVFWGQDAFIEVNFGAVEVPAPPAIALSLVALAGLYASRRTRSRSTKSFFNTHLRSEHA